MMSKVNYEKDTSFNLNDVNSQNVSCEEYNKLLKGKDFEEFIAKWLEKCGYSTEVTKDSHDYGMVLMLLLKKKKFHMLFNVNIGKIRLVWKLFNKYVQQ